jgi:uncharacterized membrane protein YeaQ/YmgE (transglycosylase-associated protein family)
MAGVILLMVIGAAAGVLAARLMQVNMDMPRAMIFGVVGALLGGVVLRLVLSAGGWVVTFVVAVLGAMALIWAWQRFSR